MDNPRITYLIPLHVDIGALRRILSPDMVCRQRLQFAVVQGQKAMAYDWSSGHNLQGNEVDRRPQSWALGWEPNPWASFKRGLMHWAHSEQLLLVGMWKRSILVPLPPLPLPLPLPFCSSNTSSYPILQNGSGQSLPHPYFRYYTILTPLKRVEGWKRREHRGSPCSNLLAPRISIPNSLLDNWDSFCLPTP